MLVYDFSGKTKERISNAYWKIAGLDLLHRNTMMSLPTEAEVECLTSLSLT